MAEVFLGKMFGAAGFEKQVAIKRILPAYTADPRMTALLIEEAKIATRLTHSNIVPVLDLGQGDDGYFLVMEYVEGADLESAQAHVGGALPAAIAGFICRQLLVGLRYVHERCDEQEEPLGLVHRDVSPPNIMLSRAGEVKLTDFGIARARGRTILTEAGVIRGKMAYLSPEQAAGGELDHRSDLYSLGVVLHEMLTGQKLFAAEQAQDLWRQIREANILPPSRSLASLPAALDQVVMQALAREPADRFDDARAFLSALDQALESAGWRASQTDLEDWCQKALPRRRFDPDLPAGRSISFNPATAPAAAGTRSLSAPETKRFRRPGIVAATLVLGAGLALILALLLKPNPPAKPNPPPVNPVPVAVPVQSNTEPVVQAEELPVANESKDAKASVRPLVRGRGLLFLNSDPWARIQVNGKDSGVTTPTVEGLRLRAGKHAITLTNPELELSYTFELNLKKDQVVKRFVDLRSQGVQH